MAYVIHGYQHFQPYIQDEDSIDEAVSSALWAVEDMIFAPLWLGDESGNIVMDEIAFAKAIGDYKP